MSRPAPVLAEMVTNCSVSMLLKLSGAKFCKSFLFKAIRYLFSRASARISKSSFVKGCVPSIITTKRSASAMARRVRSIPIDSIRSLEDLTPAVSVSKTGTPWILINSLRLSRVVPGMSVTIARSVLNKLLKTLDLPTFGRPTSVIFNPSLRRRPERNVVASSSRDCIRCESCPPMRSIINSGRSSSTNSSDDSSGTMTLSSASLTGCRRAESSPPS